MVKSVKIKPSSKKKTDSHASSKEPVSPLKQEPLPAPVSSARPVNRRALMIKTLIKGLIKNLALSVLMMGPGFVLLALGFTFLGMVGLFFGSFWMMARNYKRPWQLTILSCFIPPLVALISYLLQLVLFAEAGLPWLSIAVAVGIGVLLGWWRGQAHRLYWQDGVLFARRTFGYLISWILAYGFTQVLATAATSVLLVHAGLVTGAFTTTLLIMVSAMLLRRRKGTPAVSLNHAASLLFAGVFITGSLFMSSRALSVQGRPAVSELQRAINGEVAEDIFAASLMSGLNDQLRLTRLRRADQSEARKVDSFLGIELSTSQFTARSGRNSLKILFNVGTVKTAWNKRFLTMFGPLLMDKMRAWVLDPDNYEDNIQFADDMKFKRVNIGEYAMILSGSNERISIAKGILLCNGRIIIIGFDTHQGNRTQAVKRMMTTTMTYMAEQYASGPGAFTANGDVTTAVCIATLLMLASAGIALNLVQAVAAATGTALQTTIESTAHAVMEAAAPPPSPPLAPPEHQGPTLYDKEGKPFARNADGQYWAPDEDGNWRWLDQAEARAASEALNQELSQRQQELEHHQREADRIIDESRNRMLARNQANEEAFQQHLQEQRVAEQRIEDRRLRLMEKMGKLAEQEGGEFQKEVEQLIADNKVRALEDLLYQRLIRQVAAGRAEFTAEQNYEQYMAVGENISRAAVAASKAGLMAVGGPTGIAATAAAVGTVSAAEEAAVSAVGGDPIDQVMKKTAVGFLSGAKDGAVSVYTNFPGTGKVAKLLVPAGVDATEAYVRTGDIRQSMASAAVSLAGDISGGAIDGLKSNMAREISSAAVSMVSAETLNYANGGELGDAFQAALINHIGGKAGGRLGVSAAGHVDPEQRVRAALKDAEDAPPPDEQAPIVRRLDKSRYKETLLDGAGRPRLDEQGDPMTCEYVDTREALKQLQDTASSRTAKKAPQALQDAIIATRADKIYGPANDATIKKVTAMLEHSGRLRKGDSLELKMDPFSTPNSLPSLGADRDARLVIKRPAVPDLKEIKAKLEQDNKGFLKPGDTLEIDTSTRRESTLPPGADPRDRVIVKRASGEETVLTREKWERHHLIEVDRQDWEHIARKDFYEHTTAIARSGGDQITEESHPEYFRRRAELAYMRRPDTPEAIAALQRQGYSQEQIARFQQQTLSREQIDHQAWAETHNQLFTDKFHIEASRDNSDQAFKAFNRRLSPVQETENIVKAQKGEAQLVDPEGNARMWKEKPEFYHRNKPEAIAQAQKGIAGYMKVRDGYRAQNIEPPPIKDSISRAMEIIVRAPVGVDATPEIMDRVESDLQALGFRDLRDAHNKIAYQYELLKWSKAEQATVQVRDLGTSDLARISVAHKPSILDDDKKKL